MWGHRTCACGQPPRTQGVYRAVQRRRSAQHDDPDPFPETTATPYEFQETRMSDALAPVDPVLEPAAAEFAQATANPPYLFDLPPAEGRKAVDEVQSGEIDKPAVDE
ncbi:hypothetical protein ACFC0P_44605, partial [Streptomyces broussonetiae]